MKNLKSKIEYDTSLLKKEIDNIQLLKSKKEMIERVNKLKVSLKQFIIINVINF